MSSVLKNQRKSQIPREIKGWSWGAFFMTWIWGISNNTKFAFWVFCPVLGLTVPFILGFKGKQWAWQNNHWPSVEAFNKTQWRWGFFGFLFWLGMIALTLIIYFAVFFSFHQLPPYKMALQHVQQAPKITALLGKPIQAKYYLHGKFEVTPTSGHVQMKIPIYGPKGHAKLYVRAYKENGSWQLYRLIVSQKGVRINLIHPDI